MITSVLSAIRALNCYRPFGSIDDPIVICEAIAAL